jgi:hypothetical protein
MRVLRGAPLLALLLLCLVVTLRADDYKTIRAMVGDAKSAIESGSVEPERDLGPLVDMLRSSRDKEDQSHLVDALVDMGRGDGSSPAAVKRYLLEQLAPILLTIAADTSADHFLRGDAILGLRNLGAPRATLQKVTDIALKDPNSYVKSRGEILENYIQSMPAESKAGNLETVDPAKEQEAIAFLKERDLGVSLDQLRRSAGEGEPEEVAALLAAGVDPKGGDPGETPLDSAIWGCSNKGETEGQAKVVKLLLAAGADARQVSDNKNTPLIRAAQFCGAKIVTLLANAGADVNAINGSDVNPLEIALMNTRLDAAEALIAKGARLNDEQAEVMRNSSKDPKVLALVAKASKPKATKVKPKK